MIDRTSIRVAARTLGRHRGFTIVAVLSLAIAIALNTTMYSVLDAMFAPHIPARNPESLYELRYFGDYHGKLPPGSVERALSANVRGFEAVTGVWNNPQLGWQPIAEKGSSFRHVKVALARPNLFDVLGTVAVQGRTFVPRDESNADVIVISDWLAGQLFPDESPIGQALTIADQSYTIVGVVPRNLRFPPLGFDVWMPRSSIPITLIRYRDRVDPRVAFEELTIIAAQLAFAAGEQKSDTRFYMRGFGDLRQFTFFGFHWALIGAVLAVLLVACANLANLQLARGLARSRELALRSAVGASRRQLIVHLLIESGILATAGVLLGVTLTLWGAHIVRATIPPVMNRLVIDPQLSWRVFVFAALTGLACLFLVGLVPALHVSRVDPDSLLKPSAGTGANRANRRRYGVMVVAQIAFALPVLIGAVMVMKSAILLRDPDYIVRKMLGFDPTPIVSARVPIAGEKGSKVSVSRLAADLIAHSKSVANVVDAAAFMYATADSEQVSIYDAGGELKQVPAFQWSYALVSPSYFRTFGRFMEAGRDFLEGESDGTSVIIDAPTARFLFQNGNPIGRPIKLGHAHGNAPWGQVVGVVGDLRDSATIARFDYTYGRRVKGVYRVMGPRDSVVLAKGRGNVAYSSSAMMTYARVRGNTDLAAQRIERELRAVSRATMPPRVVPLADDYFIGGMRAQQGFVGALFSVFALVGVGLVGIGVFGIVSHSVAERKREIAVRISLGAVGRDILRSVLREGNVLLLSGTAAGLLLTMFTIQWLGGFVTRDDAVNDSVLFGAVAVVLFAIAVVAAFIPALRATRIDPVEALRSE